MSTRPAVMLAAALLPGLASALPAPAHLAPGWGARPAAAQSAAADAAAMERYDRCLARADARPGEAIAEARAWREEAAQGGAGSMAAALATHCLALALTGAGDFAAAATELQSLVAHGALAADPAMQQELRIQTGHAWLLAGQPDLAEDMFGQALEAAPREAQRWTDRARARADKGDWTGALGDLDHALRLDPEDAGTYALRAAAWRHGGNPARALEDAETALALAPRLPEALLERGILRHGAGDLQGAREDWLQVRMTAPDSPAAETAGRLLEQLDLTPEKR